LRVIEKMGMAENFLEVKDTIDGMKDDSTIPKNVKARLIEIFEILESEGDASVKVDKAIQLLDDINDDTNLQSYTRTQVWSIVSILEKTR